VRVFVSYRRGDAAGHAGRLHDELVARLGPGAVFQDVASIAPGERFLDTIDRSIGQCDVVLAVIGRRWTEAEPGTGRSRLHDPQDVVRRELEAALRTGRRLVPVLVDRAALPHPEELPPDLRPLLERNAIELRDDAWSADLRRLTTTLGLPDAPVRRRLRWPLLVAAALVVAVVVGIVIAVRPPVGNTDAAAPPPAAPPTAEPQPWPAEQTVEATYTGDGTGQVAFTVQRWWLVAEDGGTATVSVQVKVTNRTNTSISVYPELFRLLVDQVAQPDPSVGRLGARDTPAPGESTEHLLVFSRVPSGQALTLLCGFTTDQQPVVLQGGS
jgi:TIR domain